MRIALYQPDIPQNTGTILRTAACLGVGVDIIRPAGFDISDRALRRAGMDYLAHVDLAIHDSWAAYTQSMCAKPGPRLLALTTRGDITYTDYTFQPTDVLLLGRESAGLPDQILASADARLRIPVRPGLRSLNVAIATAIVTSEALRQLGW